MPTTASDTLQDDTKAPIGTVTRTLRLLSLLADLDEHFTVKTVASRLHLAPSTAHRLLQQLATEGYVSAIPETRSYETGPEFFRVSSRVLSKATSIHLVEQILAEIAVKYDETVLFGLYDPNRHALVFIARADGSNALTYRIDMNTPSSLVWGASGKAALAYLPPKVIEATLAAEDRSPGDGTAPPDLATLNEQLQLVRSKGFAISNGEKLSGARGIAAPVFGSAGLMGSICLTSPAMRLDATEIDLDVIGRDIASYCNKLTHSLGGNNPSQSR